MRKKKGEGDQLTGACLSFFEPTFTLCACFHSMRLMAVATYRRPNGAGDTWKTHFTTGTRRTSRTRVTNRSEFTLKRERH